MKKVEAVWDDIFWSLCIWINRLQKQEQKHAEKEKLNKRFYNMIGSCLWSISSHFLKTFHNIFNLKLFAC